MIEIKSKISGEVIHMVYTQSDFTKQRTELVNADNFIQCSHLKLERGKTFRPHKHIWKEPTFNSMIAQESWVVMRGSVQVSFFDLDGSHLSDATLNQGDVSFTLQGGHNYLILEDDTVVYEYKTGPYTGQENDKEFIDQ
tara:strand:+ start:303 stop:719 length:417 start_codon:yes stop_codon:yes gene_type:complete